MTDQRPIDVSTLRDGDIVRAEGTDDTGPFAFEGTVRVDKWGWGVWVNVGGFSFCVHGDDPRKGLTSIRILRPVLVKGDRVGTPVGVGVVEDRHHDDALEAVRLDDGGTYVGPAEKITRLPAAPEPAPIEVGDWWADANGEPYVILGLVGESALSRFMDQSRTQIEPIASIRATDTRLDGPPEPPVGSVYVIDGRAWQHRRGLGHVPAMLDADNDTWQQVCASYVQARLATLQIVHTLGVE